MKCLGLVLLILTVGAVGCGKRRAEDLIQDLKNEHVSVRRKASYRLVLLGKASVSPLLKAMASGDDQMKYLGAQILGSIGDKRTVSPLIELTKHEHEHIRAKAAEALGKLSREEAIPVLMGLMHQDPHSIVRKEAAWALGVLRAENAVDALMGSLNDRSPQVRKNSIASLNHFIWIREGVFESLAAKLKGDPDETVRYVAAQAVREFQTEKGMLALIDALRDDSQWVRKEAADGLAVFGDERARGPLLEVLTTYEGPDQEAAREALIQITGIEYEVVDPDSL